MPFSTIAFPGNCRLAKKNELGLKILIVPEVIFHTAIRQQKLTTLQVCIADKAVALAAHELFSLEEIGTGGHGLFH